MNVVNQNDCSRRRAQCGGNLYEPMVWQCVYRRTFLEENGLTGKIDIVVTMGCNVQCPTLPCKWREDWGLEDPSGKEDEAFLYTIRRIEEKIVELKEKMSAGL